MGLPGVADVESLRSRTANHKWTHVEGQLDWNAASTEPFLRNALGGLPPPGVDPLV